MLTFKVCIIILSSYILN